MSTNAPGGPPTLPSWGNHQPAGPSTCPRHPDQEAYVRCQRCNRPVCPQCQRPAPVGVQCVDCVAAAAKESRRTVTTFGGRASDGPPVVTLTIVGLCVAAFVGQLAIPSLTDRFAFAPMYGWVQPWRFITAGFMHSTGMYAHIALNMIALWVLGPQLERLLGRARYLALYLTSTLGAQVAVMLLAGRPTVAGLESGADLAWVTGVVGASGAIFGLFGATFVLQRALGRDASVVLALIVINTVIGFIYRSISWQAHLGGLVVGLGCALAIAAFRGREQRTRAWAAIGAVVAVLVGVIVASYLTLPEIIRVEYPRLLLAHMGL